MIMEKTQLAPPDIDVQIVDLEALSSNEDFQVDRESDVELANAEVGEAAAITTPCIQDIAPQSSALETPVLRKGLRTGVRLGL